MSEAEIDFEWDENRAASHLPEEYDNIVEEDDTIVEVLAGDDNVSN